MQKQNYSVLVRTLLQDLQERKLLPTFYTFISGKGLARKNSTAGNYSIEEYGSAKEIYYFLCGVQHANLLNLPTNKSAE